MIKIGTRVKVNRKNETYAAFFGRTGTIINRCTAGNGFAFEVEFDYPVCIVPYYSAYWCEDAVYETHYFFEDCLDLLEE